MTATLLLLLFAAACTAAPSVTPGSEASAAALPEDTPAATASPAPTESQSPAPTDESSPDAAAGAECTSDPPTAESAGWIERIGFEDDYRFSTPANWNHQEPPFIDLDVSVSPETFDRIGFPDSAVLPVDLVVAPDGSGVSAWVIESEIDTPTDELFPDELAWLRDQPQVLEIIDEDLEACLDGSTALGFSSSWSFPDGSRYIEIYMLQRNGKIYQTQTTGPDDSMSEVFAEILRTWEWTEPLEGGGDGGSAADGDLEAQLASTDFDVAGAMTGFVESDWEDGPPPQSSYDDSFGDSERIWIIYQLDPNVGDTVLITWHHEGEPISEAGDLDYAEDTLYAWSWMDPAPGGFPTGSYEVTLELDESGDRITVAFEVQD